MEQKFFLTYSIVSGNLDSAFEIDEHGRIRTAQELDYETKSQYILKVIASTSQTVWTVVPETEVFIQVLNLNDNAPSFAPFQRLVFVEGFFLIENNFYKVFLNIFRPFYWLLDYKNFS